MDLWWALRTALRVAPQSFTVGEATDTPDSLRRYRGRLDAILDFPLARALRQTFGVGSWTVGQLDDFLAAYGRYMADGPGRVSFLDNHDMNRFLFVADQDTRRLKLAALCQFTLPAVPAIYYGTEVGMSQSADIAARGDAEARQDMPWQSHAWDLDLLRFYRALVRLRATQPALRRDGWRAGHLDAADGAYAYRRELDGPEGAVTVLFNVGLADCVITLEGLAGAACLLATGAPPHAEEGQGSLRVALPALSGAVFGSAAEEDQLKRRRQTLLRIASAEPKSTFRHSAREMLALSAWRNNDATAGPQMARRDRRGWGRRRPACARAPRRSRPWGCRPSPKADGQVS